MRLEWRLETGRLERYDGLIVYRLEDPLRRFLLPFSQCPHPKVLGASEATQATEEKTQEKEQNPPQELRRT